MENGTNLLILKRSNVKTVSFALGVPLGSANEKNHGVTSALCTHLQRNTSLMDEHKLSKILDKLGINIFAHSNRMNFTFGMNLPTKNLKEGFNIFKEILLQPDFKTDTLEKIKQQTLGTLQQIQSTPNSMLTNYTRWNATFPNDPITKHPDGDMNSLNKMNTEMLYNGHKELLTFQPKFVAVGPDVSIGQFNEYGLQALLDSFGNKELKNSLISPSKKDLNIIHDKISVPTSNAYMGINFRSYGIAESDYQDEIFHAIVSGGMSTRMFLEIREKRNLSYNPYAINTKFNKGGFITLLMDVRPDRSDEALDITLNLIHNVLTEKISQDEMIRALKIAQKVSVFVSDSSRSYASFLISKLLHNEEWQLDKIKERLEKTSKTDWQENMIKFWTKKNISLSVAGDAGSVIDNFQVKVEGYI